MQLVLLFALFGAALSDFRASEEFETECSYTPDSDTLFYSPSFPYEPNPTYDRLRSDTNCNYQLKTSPGNKILLTFYYWQLGNQYSCQSNQIIIYNANGTISKHLCGNSVTEHQVLSDTNELVFKFQRENHQSLKGFLARWKSLPETEESVPNNVGLYQVSYPMYLVRGKRTKFALTCSTRSTRSRSRSTSTSSRTVFHRKRIKRRLMNWNLR